MKAGIAVLIGLVVVGIILACWVGGWHNKEVELRTLVEQKQKDNKSEFDNMWKKIKQVAQVPDMQKEALMEIFNSYAKARGGNTEGGSLATWVKEAVPTVDQTTYTKLMNIITSSRDRWTMQQKIILDQARAHKVHLQRFPGVILAAMLGREPIEVQIVTSTRTEKAFETGVDDDVSL